MYTKKGFTLIELLVVVAIIGVLATIVLSSLNDSRSRARDARRMEDMRTIGTALEMYYLDNGHYPEMSGMILSHSWGALETEMGVDLPKDPLDSGGYPYNGGQTYAYHEGSVGPTGLNPHCPTGQAYYLIYNLERTIDASENIGITRCDNGNTLKFGNNSITVGVSPAD